MFSRSFSAVRRSGPYVLAVRRSVAFAVSSFVYLRMIFRFFSFLALHRADIMAADISREVRARLGAARICLDDAAGKQILPHISALQRRALVDLLRRQSLTSEAKAEIASEAAKLKWHDEDCIAVLSVLGSSSSSAEQPALPQRRGQQSWQSFISYLTEQQWQQVSDPSAEGNLALDLLLGICFSLGLRCPTEPSMKFITSVWIVLQMKPEQIRRLSRHQKSVMFQHVRRELYRRRKNLADPIEYILKLPANPVQLLTDHPLMYKAHFKNDEVPAKCKIDELFVCEVDASYSCRNGVPAKQLGTMQQPETPQKQRWLAGQLEDSPLERMANMFIDRMVATQTRMMEMCMQGGSNASASGLSLTGLADASSRTLRTKRLPTVQFDDKSNGLQLALPGGAGQEIAALAGVESGQLVTQGNAAPACVSPGSPPPADCDPAAETGGAGAPAGDVSEQLAMLAEREAEKKAKAKAKAASTPQKPKPKGKPKAAPTAAQPKAKGSAKRKGDELLDDGTSLKRFAPPHISVERSRKQVLCRTGFRGAGQTKTMQYGVGKQYPNEAAATRAANSWLESEKARQGNL